MSPSKKQPASSAVLAPSICRAAGCSKPAFGLPYCGIHALAFQPGATRACRVPACKQAPIVHGICQAHYRRWKRWTRRVEGGTSKKDVAEWLERDWARPIHAAAGPEVTNVSTRMERGLLERIELNCEEGMTVYEHCRRALEAYARTLPEPSPAKVTALRRRRRRRQGLVRQTARRRGA